MVRRRGAGLRTCLACGFLAALGLSACGGDDDFQNDPRPPVPIAVTGVITERQVEISPDSFGVGPIVLTISNQTSDSHEVSLVGLGGVAGRIDTTTGPVNPLDTATIQQDLPPGDYEVRANSGGGQLQGGIDPGEAPQGIQPGRITVGEPRSDASDETQLP